MENYADMQWAVDRAREAVERLGIRTRVAGKYANSPSASGQQWDDHDEFDDWDPFDNWDNYQWGERP